MKAQCSICLYLFENTPTVNIAASPCGHTFHEKCLILWMCTSSTCPSCRININSNQIIKRLYFDVSKDEDNVDMLHDEICNLQTQLAEKDKQTQELTGSNNALFTELIASEAKINDLYIKLKEEQNVRDIMQRDLKVLQKENAAFVEGVKKFTKTQRRMEELQYVEALLKDCASDVQEMASQYSEGGKSSSIQVASHLTVVKLHDVDRLVNETRKLKEMITQYSEGAESSVKQLGNLLTDMKRDHIQELPYKKVLQKVPMLQREMRQIHRFGDKCMQNVNKFLIDLEKTFENFSQVCPLRSAGTSIR